MSEFTHLNRQFIAWFGSLPPHDLMTAYANHPEGVQCDGRFLDNHHRALIHTEARSMPRNGEFRLGQSAWDEFVLTPLDGKVKVRKISDPGCVVFVFGSVGSFLAWMRKPTEVETGMETIA